MPEDLNKPIFNEAEQKNASLNAQLSNLDNTFANSMSQITNVGVDAGRAAGAEGVNLAGPSEGGLNFERYYNKGAYSYLGFNPYIDNEKNYNENSSAWSDLNDMHTQFYNLAGLGFSTVLPVNSDREEAEMYERASNIGSTSRGGVFGTVGNTFLNFGYTAGLLTEIAAEEVAMSLATAATFGATGEIQAARTIYDAKRVEDAFSMADKFKKTTDRLRDLKKAYKAKGFYEKAGLVANAVNPLRGGTDYLMKGAALDKAAGMSQGQRITKTFGSFYRDLREVNLAFDEAELESAFAKKGIREELVNEYIAEHGSHPDAEELVKINEQADLAGKRALAANSALIYASNRIAFGNVFNKYMPKAIGKTTRDVIGGRVAKNFKTKKLSFIEHGTGLKGAYKTLVNEGKFAASNLKTMPLATAKFLGKYTRANFGEGMQEYFQEVIQDAEVSMAKDNYLKGVRGGAWYSALNSENYMNQYSSSLGKFAGEEGAEIFGGGFLMGMFAGPFGRGVQGSQKFLADATTKLYNRAEYDTQQAANEAKKEIIKTQINDFNSMTDSRKDFLYNYIDFLSRQAKGKTQMGEAEDSENIKAFKDVKDRLLVDQVLFAESMDAGDLLIEQLQDLGELDDAGLNEAFGEHKDYDPETMKSFTDEHASIVKRAKEISQFSQDYDKIFPEPQASGYRDDTDFGNDALTIKNLQEARKLHKLEAIVNQQALTRTMDRMESILKKPFKDRNTFWNKNKVPPASEITSIFTPQGIPQEIVLLNDEIKSLEGFTNKTPDQKRDLSYKKKKRDILKKFNEKDGALHNYITSLQDSQFNDLKAQQDEENATLEKGKTLNYKLKNKSWKGEIIGEDTKNGRERWLVKKADGKISRIYKDSKNIVGPKTQATEAKDPMQKPIAAIEKLFKDYLSVVAEHHGNSVNESKFPEVFQEFKDYLDLSEDEKNLHQTVNFLMNPEAHYDLIERYNTMIEKKYASREEDLKDQLETYLDKQDINELVNKLAKKYNVIIDEVQLQSLVEDEEIPDKFYNIDTGLPLREQTDTYSDVIDEIREYLGEDITEEVIEEDVADTTPIKGEEADGKISIDNTPFVEWPANIRGRATNMMNKYNKDTNIEGDPADDEFTDTEDFVAKGNPGYEKIAPFINEYNKQFETEEAPVKEEVKEEVKPKYVRSEHGSSVLQKVHVDSEHTNLDEIETKLVNAILDKAISKGKTVDEIVEDLNARKFSPPIGQLDTFITYLEQRIAGNISAKVGESVQQEIEGKETKSDISDVPQAASTDAVAGEELTVAQKLERLSKKNAGMDLSKAKPEAPALEEIETGKAFEIKVNDNLDDSLFSGNRHLVAFNPLSKNTDAPIEQILQGLRDGKIFRADGNLKDLKPGTVVTIFKKTGPTTRSFVRLTYMGEKNFKELSLSNEEIVDKFDLKAPGEYPRGRLIVGGSIYEVPSPVHQQ